MRFAPEKFPYVKSESLKSEYDKLAFTKFACVKFEDLISDSLKLAFFNSEFPKNVPNKLDFEKSAFLRFVPLKIACFKLD